MSIKAKDLAKQLGVSPATISLVINNKPGISDETRRSIIESITNMGYGYLIKDNPMEQRSLNGGVIRTTMPNIGFVIYKRSGALMEQSPFFPLMVEGIEAAARKNGYNLTIINIAKENDIDTQLHYIRDASCAGYVIFATEMVGDDVVPFEQFGVPFVLLDNYYINRPINCVKLNNEQGTLALVNHLVQMGHREIGYLSSGENIPSFQERRECYLRALQRNGLAYNEAYSLAPGYPGSGAYTGMKRILANAPTLPTAFLCDNDEVAFGAAKALKEAGVRIPEDLSLVGFDDRPISTMMEPALTTVKIPRASFGAEAVNMLSDLIGRTDAEEHPCLKTEIAVELVVRNSVHNIWAGCTNKNHQCQKHW